MARKVFFSFHYKDDINRTMVVRNSGAFRSIQEAGFVDKADFETVQRQGTQAIKRWISNQLQGTSVTVVLIGQHTLTRNWVHHEIIESRNRGNAIIGVQIHGVRDMVMRMTCPPGDLDTPVINISGRDYTFRDIAYSIHDYTFEDGYNNLGLWIERAAIAAGK